jgi:hypothetical protein
VDHSQELNAIFIIEVALPSSKARRSAGLSAPFYFSASSYSSVWWRAISHPLGGRVEGARECGRAGKSRSEGPCGDVKIAESRVISFKEIYLILCGQEMNSHFATQCEYVDSSALRDSSVTELLPLP